MNKKQVCAICTVIAVFLIYTLPYLILKKSCIISSWDNLDSYFIWYKVLAKYGWWVPLDFKIPEFLNGLSRNVFHSELIFQVAIFKFLTPFKAYITIDIAGRIIGFTGMYLLLKDFFLQKEKDNPFFISCVSLCFAFIPNYLTLTFLTILGQPLWLWAFLNIRKGNLKYYNWLIITLIPFCVNFELITPFFLIFTGCIWLYDLIKTKKTNPVFLLSILYCAFISLITIYRFIYLTFFDKTFVSHRIDWSIVQIQRLSQYPFFQSIWYGIVFNIKNFGEHCSHAANNLIMFPVVMFSIIYSAYKKEKKYIIPILSIFGIMVIISTVYGIFFHYKPFQEFLDNTPFLKQFQLSRFYFLLPMLWVIIFSISLEFIKNIFSRFGKYIVYLLIFSQIVYLFTINPYYSKTVLRKDLNKYDYTYESYLAEKQFEEIKNFINLPQNEYIIAVIGELPFNVPSYNGFNSINGYFNLYSKEHKSKLNKLNEKLIHKNPMYELLLVYWGHQQLIYWDENYFDTNIMREMGVKYLFSDRKIVQKENSKVKLLKIFPPKNKSNGYTVFVYELLK